MEIFWVFYNIFRFGFAVVFVGLHCVLMAGLLREWAWDRRTCRSTGGKTLSSAGAKIPLISVVIPIRNEAGRMEGLLRSLGLQDYPEAEYIFVDDRSTDETPVMLHRFQGDRRDVRIITLKENSGPNYKQYALCRGIAAAAGDLLLFTDADCEAPPSWIRSMGARIAGERTGVVIGPVFKRLDEGRDFFRFYQCFDHAIRYMYLLASTGIGAAGGGFGNNLIVRREALAAIGGYDKVPLSPTEDAALISQIRAYSKYRIHAACGADVLIMTKGECSWKALVNQTLRWNNGGLFSPILSTRLNFGFLMITISMGITAIPLLPFIPSLWPLPAAVCAAMIMNTLAILFIFSGVLPKVISGYLVQIIFTPAYFTFLTILGFCGAKSSWKGSRVGTALKR
jgi:cellulose synthase/poly-beta-1,6-N-acetylglucosamine synthase-like glycosyltransferase